MILLFLSVFSSCSKNKQNNFLGSAIIEVQTFEVSTTVQGQILSVLKEEGNPVQNSELLAVIDTVSIKLSLNDISASVLDIKEQIASKQTEISALKMDMGGLKREKDRISNLLEKGSAPQQQLDRLNDQYESSGFRIKSAEFMISSLYARKKSFEIKGLQIQENYKRCFVRSPGQGLVLTRYKNRGEVVNPGQPVFEIGVYDTVNADFFIPQPLLSDIKIGQFVKIRVDQPQYASEKDLFLPAQIVWIGNDAEFSPKNIQTRDSRNELVFKVRLKIPNKDGILKRGLPVEVWKQG
jgi:HlyD family secretion protein